MKLQILGTGCAKCRKLTENVETAAKALGGDYTIEKVTQIADIVKFGVMVTPAFVVDGQVKAAGRVPSVDELKQLIGG